MREVDGSTYGDYGNYVTAKYHRYCDVRYSDLAGGSNTVGFFVHPSLIMIIVVAIVAGLVITFVDDKVFKPIRDRRNGKVKEDS